MICILKKKSCAVCHAIYAVFVVCQFCVVFVIRLAISRRICRPSHCFMHDEFASSLRLGCTWYNIDAMHFISDTRVTEDEYHALLRYGI
jgi:hypothetical protein